MTIWEETVRYMIQRKSARRRQACAKRGLVTLGVGDAKAPYGIGHANGNYMKQVPVVKNEEPQ